MNFKLRSWMISDAESLVKNANNNNIAKFMTDGFPNPYTIDDAKAFIEFATTGKLMHIFAIDVNGEACGGIGIHLQTDIHKKNAEIGYWLGEQYWGNGIITKALKETVEFAFATYDLNRVFARPFGSNPKSQKVLEKAGFTLEGKFEKALFKNGEYHDELICSIRR